MAELVVYGRSSCSACTRFKGSCEHGGLKYRFADIDVAENKAEMLRKLRAAEWFKGGKFGLPLVDVYGRMVQRPSFAEVKAAKAMLPEEEKMEKIKAQFKDLDLNGDGTLSFAEMQILLQSLAPKLSEGQQQQLFCAADVNQNGVVELDEFIDFVMYGKEASAHVEKADEKHPSEDVVPAEVMVDEPDGFDRWKEQTLTAHNHLRAQHGALALRWSDECYRNAKKQANACQAAGKMLKGNCEGSHGRQGQNLYWNPCGCPHPNVMAQSWVDEALRPGYDFDKASREPGTEQFTQVVWRATTQVGMALSEDEKFCVANYYYPAGNIGSFQEDVRLPGTAVPHPWARSVGGCQGQRHLCVCRRKRSVAEIGAFEPYFERRGCCFIECAPIKEGAYNPKATWVFAFSYFCSKSLKKTKKNLLQSAGRKSRSCCKSAPRSRSRRPKGASQRQLCTWNLRSWSWIAPTILLRDNERIAILRDADAVFRSRSSNGLLQGQSWKPFRSQRK